MKRFKFFTIAAVALFGLCTLTPFLASCSEDAIEEQEQTLTKADILRAKAMEFAKKYNVDMTLNEENIDSLAEVLTVEQMERDFQEFAASTLHFTSQGYEENQFVSQRRLKIRRTRTTAEEREHTYTDQEETNNPTGVYVEFNAKLKWYDLRYPNNTPYEVQLGGEAYVTWTYSLKGENHVRVDLTLKKDNETYMKEIHFTPNFYVNSQQQISFHASANICIKDEDGSHEGRGSLTVQRDNGNVSVQVSSYY